MNLLLKANEHDRIIVGGDPIGRIDPMGLMDATWGQVGSAVVGAAIASPEPTTTLLGLGVVGAMTLMDKTDGDGLIDGADWDEFGPKDEECEDDKRCEEQLERDNATCAAIAKAEKQGKRPQGAARRCYSSAMERYGNCLAGRPLGPLDTWNN